MTDQTARDLGFSPERLQRIERHFAAYVDNGQLPGWQIQVSRHGQVAYRASYGLRDIENKLPVTDDTMFRIASMTKPITSVAVMMLHEEGLFELADPIAKFIPSFANPQVFIGGNPLAPVVRPATRPIEIRHLLNHTSGLTYAFHAKHPVDFMYAQSGFATGLVEEMTSEQVVDAIAALPLRFDPGTSWIYSHAVDVLGRLVEVVSGLRLDEFFQQRIFDRLGMTDTTFQIRPDQEERVATVYAPSPNGMVRAGQWDALGRGKVTFHNGGGGLVSTTDDYQRFASMLLNRGELNGQRLLGSRTVDYMTTNTLPGNADIIEYGQPFMSEARFDGSKFPGVGFGLGFSVLLDPAKYGTISSAGDYGWSGMASTAFWVDPHEDLTAIFMTQLVPAATYPVHTQLKQLVYTALID